MEYGWKITIAPDGQKRILTNIETTSQLAALIPRAIEDVYGSDPSTLEISESSASNNKNNATSSLDIPARFSIPDYIGKMVGTSSISSTTPNTYLQCPCLFTIILSPRMMNNMSSNVEFDNIKTAICSDPLLFSCIHTPDGLFQHLPPITGLRMENVLIQDSRLTRCTYANIFWNLVKTARLIDQEQYSQAYVNHGLTISKAFTLQLHKRKGYASLKGLLACETVKRLFWAVWLFDVQISTFLHISSTIDLSDIEIDRPATCDKMAQEDLDHTRFLQLLIDIRWLRVKMDVCVEESKLLNVMTQNVRQLRRFHDKLDTDLKINAVLGSTPKLLDWQRRTAIIILLELASCFLAIFSEHLGRTDTVGSLAFSMCRQAADITALLLEKWISGQFDCQYRIYLPVIAHSVSMHKVTSNLHHVYSRALLILHIIAYLPTIRYTHTLQMESLRYAAVSVQIVEHDTRLLPAADRTRVAKRYFTGIEAVGVHHSNGFESRSRPEHDGNV